MIASGQPAGPRDASTVVVVRDSGRGIEIFCVERHRRSGFMGGALVFPGGKVDEEDRRDAWQERSTPLAERPLVLSPDPATARAFAVAALREAMEEAAILPVVGDRLDASEVLELRAAWAAESGERSRSFHDLLRSRDLILDTGRLEAVSRWITPTLEPRRFDTRFYLLALPPRQSGAHDDHETTRSFWATPEELLSRWEQGEIVLAPPTSWTIGLFRDCRDVSAAFDVARRQSLSPLLPAFVDDAGEMVLALPGDPLYPGAHEAPLDPESPTRFVMEDGRFVTRAGARGRL
jgi:8-oxo-dGTP pyrophosphatase MutT (NUDIX family)